MDRQTLNKIATREQLDKTIVLTPPSVWLAVVGAFLILTALCVWAFRGELPSSMDASGIYIDDDGLNIIYAGTDGVVSRILVDEGYAVKEGQLVAVLQDEEEEAQLAKIERRIKAVEDMTLESEGDILTGDNEKLAGLKQNAGEAEEKDREALESEFNIQKEALLYELNAQREDLAGSADKKEIYAPCSGEVREVWISQGQSLTKGSKIVNIAQDNSESALVICYVPLAEAKKIKEGMSVQIYPSTVNKQEYGHIRATVGYVGSYVSTVTDMDRHLGNEALEEAFSELGPVVEVQCELETDPSTVSGYSWSGEKGSEVALEPGTLVTATIVTDKKRPIDLLLPYLE